MPTQGKDGIQAGYQVVVEVGEDHSFVLDEDTAFHHARVLLKACAMAEYDSSIYKQMRDREMDEETAYSLVVDVQKDRAPFDPEHNSTAPFTYLPALSRPDRDPVIQIRLDDKPVGLWDLDQARLHAFTLIEGSTAAQLDGVYLTVLRGVIGLEEQVARNVVDGLGAYRPEYRIHE